MNYEIKNIDKRNAVDCSSIPSAYFAVPISCKTHILKRQTEIPSPSFKHFSADYLSALEPVSIATPSFTNKTAQKNFCEESIQTPSHPLDTLIERIEITALSRWFILQQLGDSDEISSLMFMPFADCASNTIASSNDVVIASVYSESYQGTNDTSRILHNT